MALLLNGEVLGNSIIQGFTRGCYTSRLNAGMNKYSKKTIKQIADMAGVSIATVSRVINHKPTVKDDTRRKILEVLESVKEHSLPVLPMDHTYRTILLCVPHLNNPFDNRIISGIHQSAYQNNYRVFLLQSKEKYLTFEDYENVLKNHSFAGIILLTGVTDTKLLELLIMSCPIVMCSEYCDVNGISFVSIDDTIAARKATEHLISCGCKKISLLNCSLQFMFARHREQGYIETLKKAELEIRDEWITHMSSIDYSLAYSYALDFLSLPDRPDACFAVSDVYAVAVICAAKKLGIQIPRDLSIIGFDNIELSSIMSPSLTTIDQPGEKIGYQACELLIEKINNPLTSKKRIIVETELVVRESTRFGF
jgi:DNA-binding LacI/PurR family transcriptional regulator